MKKLSMLLCVALVGGTLLTGCGNSVEKNTVPAEATIPEDKLEEPVKLVAPAVEETREVMEVTKEEPETVVEELSNDVIIDEPVINDEVIDVSEVISAFDNMDLSNCQSTLIFSVDMTTEMEQNGTKMSMPISMSANLDMQEDEDTSHLSGSIFVNMFGMAMELPAEEWVDKVNNITYESNTEDDVMTWTKVVKEESEGMSSSIDSMTSVFGEVDTENWDISSDADYIYITIEEDASKLTGLTEELGLSGDEENTEPKMVPFIITINRKTNVCEGIKVDMASIMEEEGVTVNEFMFEILFRSFGEVNIDIPQDVINSAQ